MTKTASAFATFLMAHDALFLRIGETLKTANQPEINWYVVLWVLKRAPNERLRMSDLAEQAVMSRSNVTRLVDRMEKAGLVRRERVSGDRRGAYTCLTPAGKKKEREIWAVYGPAVAANFTRHLSAKENDLLRRLMARLLARNSVDPEG